MDDGIVLFLLGFLIRKHPKLEDKDDWKGSVSCRAFLVC
mgnify:CR=1 FL=1